MRLSSLLLVSVLSVLGFTQRVLAQTWSLARERPSLFEIIAVDEVGDASWPYGQEDLAADGAATVLADEAAIDLRSVYVDAREKHVWLRAYVAAKLAPSTAAVAFFFIDSDARASTGGTADDKQLWPAFSKDPTPGGYERAIGLRGDGTLLGVYNWDAQKKAWTKQPERPALVATETGVARDPLRLLSDDHGYFQIDLERGASGLDEACSGTFFVRLWNDAMGKRSFGDDAGETTLACHAHLNRYGDPELLKTDACSSDAACPGQGHCRSGLCVFGYECSTDEACRNGEACNASICVRTSDTTCKANADCDGLVCAAGSCMACSDKAARACQSGYVCTANGSCVRAQTSSTAGKGSSSPAAGSGGDQVRGGAFSCALSASHGASGCCGWFMLLGVAAVCGRRRCIRRVASSGGAT